MGGGLEMNMLTDADRKRLLDETTGHLVELIKIDTSNPPGNETPACEYIRNVFSSEGVESEIIESAPERGNIIARLKGDGSKKPLLIAGHLDVVPAKASDWDVDPFGGVVKDGCVWGRGAMDMKHNVAINMAAFMEVKRRNIPLKRDIIFCAAADEEQSGAYGMGYLAAEHYEKIDCEYALNEGGGTAVSFEGRNVYMIQNAEKGVNWVRVTTRGEPGHGSVPKQDNSILNMVEVLGRVSKPLPMRRTRIVERMVQELSGVMKFPKSFAFRQLTNPLIAELVLSIIRGQDKVLSDMISALLRDTISLTVVKAGYKENVIPEVCEAVLDCRILPGITSVEFMKMLKEKLEGAEVERIDLPVPDPTESRMDTELYNMIKKLLEKMDPGCVTTPLLMPGATDNRFLRVKGVPAYGFCPLRSKTHSLKDLTDRIHGINERVPLDALEFGVDGMFRLLVDFCS